MAKRESLNKNHLYWLTTQPACECYATVRICNLPTLEAALKELRKRPRARVSLIRKVESRIRALAGSARRGFCGGR